MQFELAARPPFSFPSVVNSHGWMQLAPFAWEPDLSTLRYVDRLSNGRVVEHRISGTKGGVLVETARLGNAEKAEAAENITWMLGLDMEFTAFYRAARGEPKLAHVRRRACGRVLRSPRLFEDVVKTILTTNTLWAATRSMTQKLINLAGQQLPGTEKRSFPTPEAVAAAGTRRLRQQVRVGYRAPALHELASRVASGRLDLEALKASSLPTPELRKELLKINGVGPYAAANLLLILGRPDFIPIDSWALKLVSHEWYRGRPVTARQVERRFEKWGRFRGLAFWFWDWTYSG